MRQHLYDLIEYQKKEILQLKHDLFLEHQVIKAVVDDPKYSKGEAQGLEAWLPWTNLAEVGQNIRLHHDTWQIVVINRADELITLKRMTTK